MKNKIFFPLYHYFHNISLEYSSIKNSSVFYVLFFFSFSSQRMFSSFSCNFFFFLFSTFRLLYRFASPLISHLFSLFLSPIHNRTHIHSRPSPLSFLSFNLYRYTSILMKYLFIVMSKRTHIYTSITSCLFISVC